MNTNDLSKPISAHTLNENLYKKFGVKINFDKYAREDLENYRNLLRTKIYQTESGSNFNSLLSDEGYQRDKFMMDLLNQKIKEMLGESIAELEGVLAERKLSSAEKAKKETTVKKLKGQKFKGGEEEMYAVATNIAKGKKMNTKKKTNEAKMSAAEAAHHHAMEYGKHHAKGNLELAMLSKDHCENHGGKLTHGHGKVFHQHSHINNGMPYECSMGGTGVGAMATEGKKAKPDFLDVDKDGNKKEPFKKAVADKKKNPFGNKKTTEALKGGQTKLDKNHNGKLDGDDFAKLRAKKKTKESLGESIARFLAEDEEAKAKDITAGVDMVNDFTSWMQRVGQYQTKSMIELADQIRQEFGQMESEAFKQAVAPALEQALQALSQTRETISSAVATLAGGGTPTPMGGGMEEPGMDGGAMPPPEMAGDEFAAADAAAGGSELAGRETREARQLFARKLSEAHSLVRSLSRSK